MMQYSRYREHMKNGICFLIGVVLATVIVLLTSEHRQTCNCLLNRELLMQLPEIKIQKKQLFARLMFKRAKWLFLFWGLSLTATRQCLGVLFLGVLGYGSGALLTLALMQYGWNGMWIVIGAVLPQAILLVPAYQGFLRLFQNGLQQHGILPRGLKYLILLVGGIYLESYVNLAFLSYLLGLLPL